MIGDLISVLNELTDRGLTKESEYLYGIFEKVAYESEARAEALLNRADPKRNPEPNERSVAADRLVNLLKDPNRPEFGYKELANLIARSGVQDTFDSEGFLGGSLTNAEVTVLRQLLSHDEAPRESGFRNPRWEQAYRDQQSAGQEDDTGAPGYDQYEEDNRAEDVELIERILNALEGRTKPVKIKRSSGVSEACVLTRNGDYTTFIVPVSDVKLGHKVLSIDHLIEDSFLFLNQDLAEMF